MDALRAGDEAVRNGGVAFLCINKGLVDTGDDDSGEDASFTRRYHEINRIGAPAAHHSGSDGYLPTHWVPLIGPSVIDPNADDNSESIVRTPLWSWAFDYDLTATATSYGEYLFFVVIGRT